jgi:hypothetical protein
MMDPKRTKAVPFIRICASAICAALLWLCISIVRSFMWIELSSETIGQSLRLLVVLLGSSCGCCVFAVLSITGDTPTWMHEKTKKTEMRTDSTVPSEGAPSDVQ